jgi:predicted adenylyl cyclase CyaB
MHLNVEFKARAADMARLENLLIPSAPLFQGEDHQVDTYFPVPYGRLKLREGRIENALIHYERGDSAESRESKVILYQCRPDASLKEALTAALGVLVRVKKKRKIYFIDNVKFHFDEVEELGSFIEVEAIDKEGTLGADFLQQQCAIYEKLFDIEKRDLVAHSYSDLLLAKKSSTI